MLPHLVPLLRDIVENETQFARLAVRLPEATRNRVMANRHRQTMVMLDILRTAVYTPRPRQLVPRANFTIDLTGDLMRTFHEPVPVIPTNAQIASAVELNAGPPVNELCAICQDSFVGPCTRLSRCGHHFHQPCIMEWFGTSVRCPVCRNDIRGEDEEEEE
jgi:hypothetical protein|uniref:RING-type domain-containing protein n=1 Tax=viral metagenome TaxID=1070528 RepID=A0A6C0JFU1_9ZZZZ